MSLSFEQQGSIAIVRLDRPPANALDHDVMDALARALDRIRTDDVRAVVLTGTGKFFSAGLDLFQVFDYPEARAIAFADAFDRALIGWFALEKPVIAAVNGHAIAGGTVLAALADFRFVTDVPGAKMGLTEILVGVPFPTSALEPVRSSCAGPRLKEVLFRGLTYAPNDAVSMRLADEVVPAGELLARSIALAEELGGRRAEAFASTKRALRADHLARMNAARSTGADPVWERWRTPELRAAMEAFRAGAVRKK